VPRFGLFERVAPKGAPVVAEWVAPSGRRIRTAGFQAPDGEHVRFSPSEVGVYHYELSLEHDGAREILVRGAFESVTSEDRGPVHADHRLPFRLSFAEGSPFFVLGENRINIYDPTWNYDHKNIGDYVAYMAEHGMTTLRVFIPSDCVSETARDGVQVGCLEPRLGQFDESAARVYDEILQAAEKHDIYVVLTANAIGFTPGDVWKGWEGNAFSRARGGPASSPSEMFTRADLYQAAERKLDYILARYGHSSHLLAIDLLNEPEWDGPVAETVWIPWAEKLAQHVRDVDPYGHLVTVGSVGPWSNIEGDERPLYADERIDFVQWHLYGKETYDPHRHAVEMARRVEATFSYGKPVFCGEFAYGGEDPALFDHTHTGLWAAAFAGGGALAHSAPPFNVDSDELMTPDRAKHFEVLSRFLRDLDLSRDLVPERLSGAPSSLRIWSLGRNDYKALWLLGPHAAYGGEVASARVSLTDMVDGRYAVRWYDDTTGDVIREDSLETREGGLSLPVPAFRRHVAAVVARRP
jgi:hypothetical protein